MRQRPPQRRPSRQRDLGNREGLGSHGLLISTCILHAKELRQEPGGPVPNDGAERQGGQLPHLQAAGDRGGFAGPPAASRVYIRASAALSVSSFEGLPARGAARVFRLHRGQGRRGAREAVLLWCSSAVGELSEGPSSALSGGAGSSGAAVRAHHAPPLASQVVQGGEGACRCHSFRSMRRQRRHAKAMPPWPKSSRSGCRWEASASAKTKKSTL